MAALRRGGSHLLCFELCFTLLAPVDIVSMETTGNHGGNVLFFDLSLVGLKVVQIEGAVVPKVLVDDTSTLGAGVGWHGFGAG